MLRASSSEAQVVRTSLLSVMFSAIEHLCQQGSRNRIESSNFHWKHTRQSHDNANANANQVCTSGWRAVMAEEFTFANVHRAVHGISRYVASQKASGAKVIVGRDPRFLGSRFVPWPLKSSRAMGLRPLVIAEPAPTPTISYAVIQVEGRWRHQLHRFAQSPGIQRHQVLHARRSARSAEATKTIEAAIAAFDANSANAARGKSPGAGHRSEANVPVAFARDRRSGRDQEAGIKIAFDPMWGSARGYSDTLCAMRALTVATIHDTPRCAFSEATLRARRSPASRDLHHKMREIGAAIGIATDGDADRFWHRRPGWHVPPAQLHHRAALRLPVRNPRLEERSWPNSVATPPDQTLSPRATRSNFTRPPVGFKYIGELIKQDGQDLIGGEDKRRPLHPANTCRRKMVCLPGCSAARWWRRAGASPWEPYWNK